VIPHLVPGETLCLAAGNYPNGLSVYHVHGTASAPITIGGPASGARAILLGRAGVHTLRIRHSSYVILKHLEVNGQNLGGDAVNGEATSHHMTFDHLSIHGCGDDQGTVGISTNRAPVWNWTIRHTTITDCGTGLYLGYRNAPFLAGLIEHNLIYDTLGYNAEIKEMDPLPNIPGLPTATTKTVIRHNVWSKARHASTGANARPNLLIGHVPLTGPGQDNYYEIYGNFYYQNPTGEPLFQGEGNFALHNNLFYNSVDPPGAYPAIYIAPHNDKPRDIRVFNNTIVSQHGGISVSGADPAFLQKVVGNAVFAAGPIAAADQEANITGAYADAAAYLTNPFAPLGSKDFFPKVGRLTGTAIDTRSYNMKYADWDRDFNGTRRTDATYRGAYFGEGTNPGWKPTLAMKPAGGSRAPMGATREREGGRLSPGRERFRGEWP
jgi:hypothetical protein